ncbi:MAG: GNAT family protein [Bacteroidales bacterium]|nr:GNAT family protein [Bacteroidales bacterium]
MEGIKGNTIMLRAMEPSDIDFLYKLENDTSVWNISNTIAPFSKFLLEEFVTIAHADIYTTKQLRMMIDILETSKTIGCIDLFDFDANNQRAGIGLIISDTSERKKGYASESLEMTIKYSFDTLNLHQLYCNILSDNLPSLNLFKKFGFEIIGLKKQWIRCGNKWEDEFMLQLLKKN